MASAELVEIHSSSSDDDFEEPERKPIGWNYQLSTPKTSKDTPRPNGTSATKAPSSTPVSHHAKKEDPRVKAPASPPVSSDPMKESDDDLEIIEVKAEPKNKLTAKKESKKIPALLPASSSRSEIRKQVRSATQSSIADFFGSKRKASEDTNKNSSKKPATNTTDKEKLKETKKEEDEEEEEEDDKSTATIEEFMRRWEEIKVSKDDEKIRDKLWKHYHLAQTSYTHSKKFIHLVEASTRRLTVDNIYVVIKDILDCLKRYKDIPYREKGSGEESVGTSREATPAPSEAENKINSRLKKVQKKMKELADKIKELENEEVDLDDDNNSSYLVEDRLKRQFSKLHDYYCRIANCSTAIGRPIERKFKFQGSKWVEINKRITAWVNKHKEFPDYVDILNLVKKVTKQSSLPLRPETVRVEAQEIFRAVGRMLKDRRESDDLYSIYSYMEDEESEDPAKQDEALNRKLNENEKLASENLEKVFQEYVLKDAEVKGPIQEDSPVKDPVKIAEGQKGKSSKTEAEETVECQKEEGNKTEGEGSVRDDNLQVMKNGSGNCIENDRNAENDDEEGDEDITSESEHDAENSDDDDDNDSNDNDDSEEDDSSVVEIEEDERVDTKERSNNERTKVEEFDDSDETDDDLKVVLASACVEEEEEDSEEDVPVVGSGELVLEQEGSSGETSSKNSILCLDDDSQEFPASTLTTHDGSVELSTTASSVVTLPDTSVDTDTTIDPLISSKSPQKRQQEENLSPCKRICI